VSYLSVADAQTLLQSRLSTLPADAIPLRQALGRTLAAPVLAGIDVPPFARAAMDGYAVRADECPGTFTVVGQVRAGTVWPTPLEKGQAVRILTGAPVPVGATAVVEQERVIRQDNTVQIERAIRPGWNIMEKGHEYRQGQPLFEAGHPLDALSIGQLAAVGVATVPVRKRPRILVATSGDELVAPGAPLGPGQVYDTNGPLFEALLTQWGATVDRAVIPDDADQVAQFFHDPKLQPYSLVLTTGGASVGDYDFIPQIFARDFERLFWRLDMHPGKAVAAAQIGTTLAIALSGNPGAALIGFYLLVLPALAQLLGRSFPLTAVEGVLTTPYPKPTRETRFLKVRLRPTDEGFYTMTPLEDQSSDAIRSFREADGLAVIPHGAPPQPAGTRLSGWLLPIGP